jgi:hypothetical protein
MKGGNEARGEGNKGYTSREKKKEGKEGRT